MFTMDRAVVGLYVQERLACRAAERCMQLRCDMHCARQERAYVWLGRFLQGITPAARIWVLFAVQDSACEKRTFVHAPESNAAGTET